MTKLYFVRHGFTENNAKVAFNGSQSNHGLLPEGRQQATRLGDYLKETSFAKVYASPQIRALETAELIIAKNECSEKKIIQDKRLKEIDFGQWDGVPVSQKMEEEQYKNYKLFPHKYDPRAFNGETYAAVVQRGKQFINQLEFSPNENLLIVSHGVLLMSLLKILTNKKISQIREDGLLDNASLSILETENGNEFQQLLWNFTNYH